MASRLWLTTPRRLPTRAGPSSGRIPALPIRTAPHSLQPRPGPPPADVVTAATEALLAKVLGRRGTARTLRGLNSGSTRTSLVTQLTTVEMTGMSTSPAGDRHQGRGNHNQPKGADMPPDHSSELTEYQPGSPAGPTHSRSDSAPDHNEPLSGCMTLPCSAHHSRMSWVDHALPIRNSAIGAGKAPELSSCRSRVLLRFRTSVSSVHPSTGGSSGTAGSDITAHLRDFATALRRPGSPAPKVHCLISTVHQKCR